MLLACRFLAAGLGCAVPLAALQANSPDLSRAPVAIRPANWVQEEDFPSAANNKQGATRFVLAIDATGRAYRCDVTQSSGVALLDQHTCALMLRRAKFEPATDQTGAAVPSEWSRTVDWGTNGNAAGLSAFDAVIEVKSLPAKKKRLDIALREVIGSDGSRENCAVDSSSKNVELDRQACALTMAAAIPKPLLSEDNTPIRGLRVTHISFVTDSYRFAEEH